MTAFILLGIVRSVALADPAPSPVFGVDPLPAFGELENRTEGLQRWAFRGYDKAVLLHVDTHARARPIGTGQAAVLAAIRSLPAGGSSAPAGFESQAKRSAFETAFVTGAVSLGIVRETYWIVPFDYFRTPDPASSLRADMKAAGFLDEDLHTFALRDGCFRGRAGGAPFAVCGLESLPQIAEPVLLDISADFALSAAAARGTNPVTEYRKLLAAMAARKYAVVDAVLFASVDPGEVPPDLRWVGETMAQALRDPALLASVQPPKRWTLLQSVAMLQGLGNPSEALHQILPYLTIHEDDPALQLYAAQAMAGLGNTGEALVHAELACRLHQGYCSGLPWIGLHLFAAGDLDGGERFFSVVGRMRPKLAYGQVARGIALKMAGRLPEALKVFLAVSEGEDAFPGGFLAGGLLSQRGDREGAVQQFDRALDAMRRQPDAEIADPEIAQAIRDAVRLYRAQGLTQRAQVLEDEARLKIGPEEPPPAQP